MAGPGPGLPHLTPEPQLQPQTLQVLTSASWGAPDPAVDPCPAGDGDWLRGPRSVSLSTRDVPYSVLGWGLWSPRARSSRSASSLG